MTPTDIQQVIDEYAPRSQDEHDFILQWSATAAEVQSASNLTGVVRSLITMLDQLWVFAHAPGRGTQWVNNHPLVIVFVDKLRDMSTNHNENEGARVDSAFDWVFDMRKKGKEEKP